MSLEDKVALVTGAGSGVGRASVLALLKKGYKVVLAGRRQEMLEETIALSNGAKEQTLVVPTDITIPDAVKGLFEQISNIYGRLDVLFNNAGHNVPGVLFEELTIDQWKSVVKEHEDTIEGLGAKIIWLGAEKNNPKKSFIDKDTYPFLIKRNFFSDIDNIFDFKIAEFTKKKLNKNLKN